MNVTIFPLKTSGQTQITHFHTFSQADAHKLRSVLQL